MSDFVLHDEFNHSNIDDVFYKHDTNLPRNNLDSKRINNSGKHLLNVCKEAGLRILNGPTTCDLFGRPTCFTCNGCSLVDYTIVSNELLHSIGFFQVQDFTALSNHCPIVCGLISKCNTECTTSYSKLAPLPGKFIWTDQAIELFKSNIQSETIKNKVSNFMKNNFDNVNNMVEEVNSILVETANMSAKFVKNSKKQVQCGKVKKKT